MKKTLLVLLIGLSFIQSAYSQSNGVSAFLTTLDQEWSNQDYSGLKAAIEARLSLKPNDLPALVAKLNYYTTIESNPSIIQSLCTTISQVESTIDWSKDQEAKAILDGGLDDCLHPELAPKHHFSLMLTSAQLSQLHTKYPNKYYGDQVLLRFGNIQYPNG